jgi:hypothetical protein
MPANKIITKGYGAGRQQIITRGYEGSLLLRVPAIIINLLGSAARVINLWGKP